MDGSGHPVSAVGRRERPARRFEAPRPLCLVQMDTTSGQWLTGKRSAHVIVTLDDYSRAVLAGRAVEADSTVNNLTVLEAAVERYGAMEVLYSDNGSVFRTTRYAHSRFYSYRPEVLAGEESPSWHGPCVRSGRFPHAPTGYARPGQTRALESLLPGAGLARWTVPERCGAR